MLCGHRWFLKWSTRSRKSQVSRGWCTTLPPSLQEPQSGSRTVDFTIWPVLVSSTSPLTQYCYIPYRTPESQSFSAPATPFSHTGLPCHCPTETEHSHTGRLYCDWRKTDTATWLPPHFLGLVVTLVLLLLMLLLSSLLMMMMIRGFSFFISALCV